MAFARQASFGDENKKVDVKGAMSKGAARVPLGGVGGGANGQNHGNGGRRALGDIGNLVGALNSRSNVSKDGMENSSAAVQKQAALAERAQFRRASTSSQTISKDQKPRTRAAAAAAAAAAASTAPTQPPMPPAVWGATRPRKSYSKPREDLTSVSADIGLGPAAMDSDTMSSTRSAAVARRGSRGLAPINDSQVNQVEHSLTKTLTARSEAACGGFDLEMEEAEEAIPDIDAADHNDVLCVVDYVEDIYSYYRRVESQSLVAPDYMSHQTDINDKMRAILIDWLVEVHLKFKLEPETIFLTANVIDRFLSKQQVTRKNLQLVGVTAMLLASKYEEIWAPEVRDFVFISDNAYTRDQILGMEKLMLNTLKFNLTVPTPYVFMCRFLKAAEADRLVEMVAYFLVELCLQEYCMLRYSPSHLAAVAVYTSLKTLGRMAWSPTLQCHTGYCEDDLRQCSQLMTSFHRKSASNNLKAVSKKYTSTKFLEAARFPPCPLEPVPDTFSSS